MLTSFNQVKLDKFYYLALSGYMLNTKDTSKSIYYIYLIKHKNFTDLTKLWVETKHTKKIDLENEKYGPLKGSKLVMTPTELTIVTSKRIKRIPFVENTIDPDFKKEPILDYFLACNNNDLYDSYPQIRQENDEYIVMKYGKDSKSFESRAIGLINKRTKEVDCLNSFINFYSVLYFNQKATSEYQTPRYNLIVSRKDIDSVQFNNLTDHSSMIIDGSKIVNPAGEIEKEMEFTA